MASRVLDFGVAKARSRVHHGNEGEIKGFVEITQASSSGRIVGESSAMKKLYPVLTSLAATDQPILLEGEAGTGKELVAEELHLGSRRKLVGFRNFVHGR